MKNNPALRSNVTSAVLAEMLRVMNDGKNYMATSGAPGVTAWSVTELMQTTGTAAIVGRGILAGVNVKNNRRLQDGQYRGPETVRLQVLSRQACHADKDGKPINHAYNHFALDPEACETDSSAPQEGDFVLLPTNFREYDDFGRSMNSARIVEHEARNADKPYVWRDGLREHYVEYQVDRFGCITVRAKHALDFLNLWGERVVFPRWRNQRAAATGVKGEDGKLRKVRRITNWRFREVHPDAKIKPLTGGKIKPLTGGKREAKQASLDGAK